MAKGNNETKPWILTDTYEEVSPGAHACGGIMITSSVVTEQVARDYIDKFNLTIHYSRELKDGTPRRLWDIHDPSGNKAGSLYTAQGAYGFKNREPWKDIFDFAEFRVSRDDWDDVDFKEPQTAHFDFKVKK